ncbi:MAG: tRNA (adenosine(37)-N6)-threonylcarbamoyltransferase complex ATPase subunit type 1 TsaE [bacterium]|nr:tRNA (adenosine(37)-N6)-threonylcarbamoyltransferase complex ATPase subunit type 1 TsaE [Candidatus Aquidulcis sp.]
MSLVTITLRSLAETTSLGAAIGASLLPGDRILLSGDLGSGKTTLARAIGAALHAEPELTSPTFVLVAEHRGDLPIWHVDAYRLPVGSDALRAGIVDERQQRGVTLIEWPEHLVGLGETGADVLKVHLVTADDEGSRIAEIRGARPELLAAINASFGQRRDVRG